MTRGADRPEPPPDLADLPLRPRRGRPENLNLFGDAAKADGDAESQPADDSAPPLRGDGESPGAAAAAQAIDLEASEESGPLPPETDEESASEDGVGAADGDRQPAFGQLVLAAAADVVVHVGVLSLSVLAMAMMGLRPSLDQWPGFGAFALLFSFLYLTIPLAFWGQSPGMAWSGVRARDSDGRPLTFGQTALRWLASLVCLLLVGAPLLIALTGRSLADRLSRSRTVRVA